MVYWIWLTQIKGIGPKRQRRLLEKFNTPENIYKKTLEELLECDGIGYNMAEKIIKERSLKKAEKILNNVKKQNIKLLTLKNPLYPTEAKNIKEMPVLIYYKGNLIENSMGVSIVGSRRCSQYGKKVATDAGDYLARENIWVISGMAKGIDSYAHTSCIKAGGYTIAVLGNGLDICYPQEHIELMKKIIQNGAVISEYPPGTRPDPKHFPRRNLLISGWSYKILVVEAGAKSGALITADYGKKYKRQVLALPDNIYSKESIGSNRLIGNGAKIYLSKEQLLINNRYERESASIDNSSVNHCILNELDDMEKRIIEILIAEGEKTLEQLSFFTGINTMNLVEKLSIMELENKVIIQGSVVKAVCPLETLSKRK
ncbi:DNA-processing protein DprA [Maledivibacter halophilus]|uniref:DNA processing protein n=1 Tax=Maledivibacter halophilus TaxID=36842 RepID=A0A1T5K0S7_9FIRM|nr:DNA-processing protein DprA [Maledivibacter halophilus]SKC57367.1 DNA processing protein [Maledivibacter halophilus]